jgi:outer membrane protein TolC
MTRWLTVYLCAALSFGPLSAETPAVFKRYVAQGVPAPSFENSSRLRGLIRGGNLYLSLSDAIALAIENNLDVDLLRYSTPIAASDLLRAQGGGLTRGLYYTIAQPPAGVGGPLSPLLTQAATQSTPGTSVASNALELGVLAEPQVNLSTQTNIPLSAGSPIPAFDPSLFANYNWTHQDFLSTAGIAQVRNNIQTGNVGFQQAFAPGTAVTLAFNNTAESTNAPGYVVSPFINSNLALTVTQPLLRGFGRRVNERFIRIGATETQIGDLLFRQQLIEVVYGIVRLYTDLVALTEDVKVKEETVAFAQKLLNDTTSEVEEGVIAPLELSRARAQVSGSRQDLINSRGLLEEQEAIVKNVITRRGIQDADIRNARIIPTETLPPPDQEPPQALEKLIEEAFKSRPDLGTAELQTRLTEISLEGSKNNVRPELDLVGVAQNNGLAGQPLVLGTGIVSGGYGTVLDQIATRKNPTYAIGLNLTLPLRNRVAQADEARDELQLRQVQIRERQFRNQVQLEVQDAVIAMRRAMGAFEAATETRALQEQSLSLEQTRYTEGVSTGFFVAQYESYVAQARSAEVAAKSAYIKARAALERAVGSILDVYGVEVDAAATRR